MGKPVARQHLPQLANRIRIALKVRKWHAAILNMKIEGMSGGFPPFGAIYTSFKMLIIKVILDLFKFFEFFYHSLYFRQGL